MDDSKTPPNDNVVDIKRTTGGQFVKGVSGNPLGGNRMTLRRGEKTRAIQKLYEQNAPAVLRKLMELILEDATPAGARVSAIKEFNDRHQGKARQAHVIKTDADADAELDFSGASDDLLRALAELKIAPTK